MAIKDDPNGGQAEDDNDGSDDCALRPCEGEPNSNKGKHDEHKADGAVGISASDEALINMRAMRGEHVLTTNGALNKRDARIHDDGPHQ